MCMPHDSTLFRKLVAVVAAAMADGDTHADDDQADDVYYTAI